MPKVLFQIITVHHYAYFNGNEEKKEESVSQVLFVSYILGIILPDIISWE